MYADTDMMGVIYHGNYLKWFEVGRMQLIEDIGYDYVSMEQKIKRNELNHYLIKGKGNEISFDRLQLRHPAGKKLILFPGGFKDVIIILVGLVIGSWIGGGIVATMIYYGLALISPALFLVTITLLCAIVALSIGSSWSTMATVGVAGMGHRHESWNTAACCRPVPVRPVPVSFLLRIQTESKPLQMHGRSLSAGHRAPCRCPSP